jgi:hypothetical protein
MAGQSAERHGEDVYDYDAPLPPCSCGTLTDLGGLGPQHDRWCLRFRMLGTPPASGD